MCGLAGLFGTARSGDDFRVRRMTSTLRHRGPDDEGFWCESSRSAMLGFRRLAIVDISNSGHQPMISADGRLVITFNGEIYNFRELRAELSSLGHSFSGSSDTEVALAAFSQWGIEDAVTRLWGMFAIAVWDRTTETGWLIRDRLGKKPLYYTERDGQLWFASELKALHEAGCCDRPIDAHALSSYVTYGYIPGERTIYDGIRKVAPGHLVRVRNGAVTSDTAYWDAGSRAIATQVDSRLTAGEAEEHLLALLRDSTSRRMISDVSLGAFLSGGIDSSLVVALMQEASAKPVQTFTLGFDSPQYDESKYAAAIAERLNTEHSPLTLTPQIAQEIIPSLGDMYDEPFGDASAIPMALLCRLTKRHVTVALSGDGGDEVFAGYKRYRTATGVLKFHGFVPGAVRRGAARALIALGDDRLQSLYGSLEECLPKKLQLTNPSRQLRRAVRLLQTEKNLRSVYHPLLTSWDGEDTPVVHPVATDVLSQEIADRLPPLRALMLTDLTTYLPDDVLVKVDRASMASSLEVRSPLLDHRIVEWSWSLPDHLLMSRRGGKVLLKSLLHRFIPDLPDRPKMGFAVPLDEWLRHPLRDWAEDLLSERRLRDDGVFKTETIRRTWNRHLSGDSDEQLTLWPILMFQSWQQAAARTPVGAG